MKDKLVANIHLLFLAYAIMLGVEKFDVMEQEYNSSKNDLTSSQSNLKKMEKNLEDLKRFESNLEESKVRVKEVVERMEKVQRQLPSDINVTEVNGTLTDFSNELRMLDPSPTPKEEQPFNFYVSKDFNFDAKGTFLQFLIFFEKLEKLSNNGRILNVKYLRFFESNEGDRRSRFKILGLTTTVEAYKYKKFDPDKVE